MSDGKTGATPNKLKAEHSPYIPRMKYWYFGQSVKLVWRKPMLVRFQPLELMIEITYTIMFEKDLELPLETGYEQIITDDAVGRDRGIREAVRKHEEWQSKRPWNIRQN